MRLHQQQIKFFPNIGCSEVRKDPPARHQTFLLVWFLFYLAKTKGAVHCRRLRWPFEFFSTKSNSSKGSMNKKTTVSQNTMAWVGRRGPGSRNVYARSENSIERNWQKLTSYMNAPWARLPYGNRMAETSATTSVH